MTMPGPATGAELPDLFADERARHVGPGAQLVGGFAAGGAVGALGSATVALHTRADISPYALYAGVLTLGTASDAEHWAGGVLSARGRLIVLDSGHLGAEGVRRSDDTARLLAALWAEPAPTAYADAILRAVREVLSGVGVGAPAATYPATGGDADEDGGPALVGLARAMTDVPAAVAVQRPAVPELTDEPLENVRRLFALTVGQLADLLGVTERQAHRYLREGLPENRREVADALTAVGLTVVGGLGPDGARRWLLSGQPSPAELAGQGRTAELRERAEALRDSPAT